MSPSSPLAACLPRGTGGKTAWAKGRADAICHPLYAVIRMGQGLFGSLFGISSCNFCGGVGNYVCGQTAIRHAGRRSVQRAQRLVAARPEARGVLGHDDVGVLAVRGGAGVGLFRGRGPGFGVAPVRPSTQAPGPDRESDPNGGRRSFARTPAGGAVAGKDSGERKAGFGRRLKGDPHHPGPSRRASGPAGRAGRPCHP